MNIIIINIPERSALNAGLVVAQALARRGHQVTFLGDTENMYQAHIEQNGFRYVAVGPSEALVARFEQSKSPLERLALLGKAKEEVTAETLVRLRSAKPDLVFLDVNAEHPPCYALAELRIPTILINNTYSSYWDLRWPPTFSGMLFPDGDLGFSWKVRNWIAWQRARFSRMVLPKLWPPAGLVDLFFTRAAQRRVEKHGKQHGWSWVYGDWGPRPNLPEVVVGYKALDWPALHTAQRFYLPGHHRDLDRQEAEAVWPNGAELTRKKLVYCSVSSLFKNLVFRDTKAGKVLHPKMASIKRFLDTVVQIAAQKTDWALVVACGPFAQTFDQAALPPNVQVFERVAQIPFLKKATLAITHGGASTVRECVHYRVPMVVFPIFCDQFGNAARVTSAHVGCGVALDITGEALAAAIDSLLTDQAVGPALTRLAEDCSLNDESEAHALAEWVYQQTAVQL